MIRTHSRRVLLIAAGTTAVLIVVLMVLAKKIGHPSGLLIAGGLIVLLAIEAFVVRLAYKRQTELAELAASRQCILEALPQAVIRLDVRNRVDFMNPAARMLLNLSPDTPDFPPETPNLIDGKTRRPVLESLLAEAENRNPNPLPAGTRLITGQGIELEVEGSCTLIRSPEQQTQSAVLILRDLTEELEWARRQPDLWDRDPATALPGRDLMINRLVRMLELERAGERPISYIQITFDGIEQVYRETGQQAGDALVRHLANLLRSYLRDTDLLARMNTQVFGALLVACPQQFALRIMTEIERGLSVSHFSWEDKNYTIQARFGSVTIPPFQGSVEELFAAADRHD